MPQLSKRLKLIASLVPKGARVCDVGTDHGYLSIELIKSGVAASVIATDVNEKPLNRAKINAEKSDCPLELRLCDGLKGINPDEVDTVIIAGMGGEVISGILERGKEVANKASLILLQPTTSPEALREFLFKNGYEILKEEPLLENEKLYSVIVCRYSGTAINFNPYSCFIGKLSPETIEGRLYIEKQHKRCLSCANALKNIPDKYTEYTYYNSIALALKDILNSVGDK